MTNDNEMMERQNSPSGLQGPQQIHLLGPQLIFSYASWIFNPTLLTRTKRISLPRLRFHTFFFFTRHVCNDETTLMTSVPFSSIASVAHLRLLDFLPFWFSSFLRHSSVGCWVWAFFGGGSFDEGIAGCWRGWVL